MRTFTGLLAALLLMLLVPAIASAHIERASYWPDPAPDCAVKPCAGGAVPKVRSLASALKKAPPGDTRVVCKSNSLKLLRASIRRARKDGYDIRPTDHRSFSAKQGRKLLRINKALAKRCAFKEIQAAVTASHNNDRVVVMPGLYTEPTARKAKTNDPKCAEYKIVNDKGSSGALSYEYQFRCPNDQNLVAVIGRGLGTGTDPEPPLVDRHKIPNLGPCIRCNLQLEGSGVNADDVIVEAGRAASGDAGPRESAKDVGIRGDRADGFVLRNVKVRHAKEHDIYLLEVEGYMLDRFKVFWGGEYGVLTFVGDHGVMRNCEAAGSGDSGLYPGSGADTGVQREPGTEFRYSQRLHHCDSHHSSSGYSGTNGNATHIDHNNFYDNALGWTTDVFTAPGHPGFPQDSDLVEYNNFYSNNFNPYDGTGEKEDIQPSIPAPVGTGMWIAGGNDNVIRFNRFWDNRRRGVMLFAVPDATVCGPGIGQEVTGCDSSQLSTSYRNHFYGNIMGTMPNGEVQANGTDFWWDSFPGNTGNCWWDNTGSPEITTAPAGLPDCAGGKQPEQSMGVGSLENESELLGCFGAVSSDDYNPGLCPWFETPAKPGSKRAARQQRAHRSAVREVLSDARTLDQVCAAYKTLRPAACERLPGL